MAVFDKIWIFNIDSYKILNIDHKTLNLSDIVTNRDGRRFSGQGLKWPMSVWKDANQWGIQIRHLKHQSVPKMIYKSVMCVLNIPRVKIL